MIIIEYYLIYAMYGCPKYTWLEYGIHRSKNVFIKQFIHLHHCRYLLVGNTGVRCLDLPTAADPHTNTPGPRTHTSKDPSHHRSLSREEEDVDSTDTFSSNLCAKPGFARLERHIEGKDGPWKETDKVSFHAFFLLALQ
jgi:hypothetical protein